jgi:hypothetical protein
MDLIEASAVILAQGHNPTILHPSFLVAQGIVPAEWELAAPPISMPPLATATYNNGISFAADESRLIVRDARPIGGRERFRAYELARLYAQSLPHVPYAAVGVNFQAFLPVQNPLQRSLEHIFRREAFENGFGMPESFNLSLQRSVDGASRTITLSPTGRDFGRDGLILTANYHVSTPAENRLANTVRALGSAENRWRDFEQFVRLEEELREQ